MLKRFGNVAVDWSRVYAATCKKEGRTVTVNLWVDLPGEPKTIIELKGPVAATAMELIDGETKKFENAGTFYFEKAKVCRIDLPEIPLTDDMLNKAKHPLGKITFDLGDNRSVVIEMNRDAVEEILSECH